MKLIINQNFNFLMTHTSYVYVFQQAVLIRVDYSRLKFCVLKETTQIEIFMHMHQFKLYIFSLNALTFDKSII